MEIGAYSFGDTQLDENGQQTDTAGAIRNLHEAIVHADAVGLDYFGVGEHHTMSMPASSPGAVIAAAAGATKQITLGSGASIISTDDPVRGSGLGSEGRVDQRSRRSMIVTLAVPPPSHIVCRP